MKREKFSFRKRLKSFGYAFNGLKVMFLEEHNSWIHLVAALVVMLAGWYLEISPMEWMVLLLVIGAVFAAELFNSAVENLSDYLAPEKHDRIKKVKDLAAAAVLVCALTAFVVGLILFLPKIIGLFH